MKTTQGMMAYAMACALIASSGCGKDKGTSGQAKFALANGTGTALSLQRMNLRNLLQGPSSISATATLAPSVFKVKFIGVGIKQEADTTVYPASAIYSSPDCTRESLQSEVDGVQYDYVGFSSCDANNVSTFFDLALPTTEVNTALNAQNLPILPGSYKYAFINFCQGATTGNVKFQATGMSAEATVTYGGCGVDSAEISPAHKIDAGQAVNVTLTYDLSAAVSTTTVSGDTPAHCADDGGTRYCINFPAITPAIAAQ